MADRIGQILIRKGKITREQLLEALRTQEFFGGYLGSHLINLGYLDEASLSSTLAEIHGVPSVSYKELRAVARDVASVLTPGLAQKFSVVPLKIEGTRLTLAMTNPHDAAAMAEIASATGLQVVPHVAPEFRIAQALEKLYRVRREGKRRIVVKSEPALAESPPSISRTAAGSPASVRATQEADLGLDGLPLSATGVVPEMDAPLSSGAAPHKTEARQESYPKSLRDWREFDDEPEEGEAAIAEMEPEAPPSPPPARVGGLEAPATLEEVAERLSRATTREEICRPLVQFMARHFGRAAMLAVLPDRTRVLDAAGEGVSAEMAREFSLPTGLPSLFEPLRSGKSFHLGPVGALHPGTRLFFAAVGGAPPPSALVLPVLVRGRPVALLYADNRSSEIGPVDLAVWRRLSSIASVALETELLRRKLRSS
ncbi:MAG: hypothetical protein DMF49_09365 [Acidobacteria bacterium]|nr:MAG: hypothetical protein DMF49_09365 [Acidobacteriota bacterium]